MFTLPELPYAFDSLEPAIDRQTMQIHHGKHHAAYVKNVNDAFLGMDELLALTPVELVKNLAKVPEAIRTKVRNNAGGHVNHSLFWTVMAPLGNTGTPSVSLTQAIGTAFGGIPQLQEQMNAKAIARFGSGWAWLVVSGKKLELVDTPNQDSPYMEGKTPILGVDVWEHAYYLKYQNLRADYLKAWWTVVNWTEVSRRFEVASE